MTFSFILKIPKNNSEDHKIKITSEETDLMNITRCRSYRVITDINTMTESDQGNVFALTYLFPSILEASNMALSIRHSSLNKSIPRKTDLRMIFMQT